jgi:hypothetical protein
MGNQCRELRQCIKKISSGNECDSNTLKLLTDLRVLDFDKLTPFSNFLMCESELLIDVDIQGNVTRTVKSTAIALREIKTRQRIIEYVKLENDAVLNISIDPKIKIKSYYRKKCKIDSKKEISESGNIIVRLRFNYEPPLEAGDVEEYSFTKMDLNLHRMFRENDEEETVELEGFKIIEPTLFARITVRFPLNYPLKEEKYVLGGFSTSPTMNAWNNYVDMNVPVEKTCEGDKLILTSELRKPVFPATYAVAWRIPTREEFERYLSSRKKQEN